MEPPALRRLACPRAGKGFCADLNLLSADTADVVATCNTFYTLLLRHDRDETFKGQLKNGAAAAQRGGAAGGMPPCAGAAAA